MKKRCERCGKTFESSYGQTRFCGECTLVRDFVPTKIKQEFSKIWLAMTELKCKQWELEKCLKYTHQNNIQKKFTKKCLQKEE